MKKLLILCFCIFCFSCKKEAEKALAPNAPKEYKISEEELTKRTKDNLIKKESFQKIIDSVHLKGSILLYDAKTELYYSNDFIWAFEEQLPASTYKIPNSIIALETKAVADQNTIFKWNGEKRFFKSWEADLTLHQAFQRSCVPCYQEVARKIGVKRMNAYIEKLQYGNIKVDSINLDNFWLRGNASISQFQQIDFLKRFQQESLPISKRTSTIVKEIMILKETDNYVLRGKTGWSIEGEHHNGWFVGYVESSNHVFFFATNVAPTSKDFDQKAFQKNRKEVTYKALGEFINLSI
ncbi:class D beta-lactamase [Kordia sp.]|uniref:class D beta-lactamase n=1 Tax=Kordia sp. TaxID=1965332 RepID=UPI003D6BE030